MVDEEEAGEEEDIIRTAGRLWPFGKATLGARQIGAQRGAKVSEGGAGEEDINHVAGSLWSFGKATLGAQQIGAQRGTMMDEEGAGEEDSNRTGDSLCPFLEADAVAAGQRTMEPHVVESGIDSRPTSVISRGEFSLEL